MDRLHRVVATGALVGFVASLGWHLASITGYPLSQTVGMGLFVGVFAVWFPTVFYLQRFNGLMHGFWGWKAWKHMAFGAPVWMKAVAPAAFVYAMVNFFLATGGSPGSVSDQNPLFGRVGSGHAMAFYSVAMLFMTAAARRNENDLDWRCVQGHEISPEAKFCEKCGSPARELRSPAGA